MQRSSLAKWAMTRRVEAHFGLPALGSVVLITFYLLAPPGLRDLILPGLIELPFISGRTIGIAHLLTGVCMAWIMILGTSTLIISRNPWVWLCTVAVLILDVFILLMWLDGHTLTSRAAGLWLLTAEEQGSWSRFLAASPAVLDLAAIGTLSFILFVALPLLYGGSRHAIVATLVPIRWLIATAATLYGSFWLAVRLQGPDWAWLENNGAALGADIPTLLLPVFFYMLLLYVARIQYRCWVRREAGHWKTGLNGR